MPEFSATPLKSAIYSAKDYEAINNQLRRRWLAVGIPCAVLLAAVVASLFLRVEAVTIGGTVLIGGLIIFVYDLYIRPLGNYRSHLKNVLYGHTHETVLPFLSLSETATTVDGVSCRTMLLSDVDGKGRPSERLFYLDARKTCPDFHEGEMLRVVHHDLMIADVTRA